MNQNSDDCGLEKPQQWAECEYAEYCLNIFSALTKKILYMWHLTENRWSIETSIKGCVTQTQNNVL